MKVAKIIKLFRELKAIESSTSLMIHNMDFSELDTNQWNVEGQVTNTGMRYWVAKPIDPDLEGITLFERDK